MFGPIRREQPSAALRANILVICDQARICRVLQCHRFSPADRLPRKRTLCRSCGNVVTQLSPATDRCANVMRQFRLGTFSYCLKLKAGGGPDPEGQLHACRTSLSRPSLPPRARRRFAVRDRCGGANAAVAICRADANPKSQQFASCAASWRSSGISGGTLFSVFSGSESRGHQSGGQSGAQRASRLGLSPAAASLLRAIAPALRRSAQRSMPAIDRRRSSSAQSAGCRPLRLVDFRPYALLPMRRIHASNLSTQPERKTRVVSSVISWASSMTPGLNWK